MLSAKKAQFGLLISVAVNACFFCLYMFYRDGVCDNYSNAPSKALTISSDGPHSFSKMNLSYSMNKLNESQSWIIEDDPPDRFCIVLHTFVRTDLILLLLKHYSKLPKLTRIIVVWSDKTITPPLRKWEELGPHSVPVHFKVQERNSIMNKLQPFPEIDTPGNTDLKMR